MTIVAIDYGKRRLGIAAADKSTLVVFPQGVIERRSIKRDLSALRARLEELEATLVIVGLPLNMDGSAGPAALEATHFAQILQKATGLEVQVFDERLSTFEAKERLRTGSRHHRRRAFVDAVAAAVILEAWLQRQPMAH
jgi:putative Holliday junction resolvase